MAGFSYSKYNAVPVGVRLKREKKAPVDKRVWERFIGFSLAGLEKSIEEAKGRFDSTHTGYAPYDKPKASKNWKLSNPKKTEQEDYVQVYFKCGKSAKIGLFEGGATTIRVPAKEVVQVLQDMKAFMTSPSFRNSVEGRMFHKRAIEISKPKRNPSAYHYDELNDMWVEK